MSARLDQDTLRLERLVSVALKQLLDQAGADFDETGDLNFECKMTLEQSCSSRKTIIATVLARQDLLSLSLLLNT